MNDERKNEAAEAGMELTDGEIEKVAGGGNCIDSNMEWLMHLPSGWDVADGCPLCSGPMKKQAFYAEDAHQVFIGWWCEKNWYHQWIE